MSESTMLARRQASGPPAVPLSANPFAAIIAITAIMGMFVAAKLLIRLRIIKKFGLEDWSALVGALFVIAMTGVIGSVFQEAGLNASSAIASPGQIADPVFAAVKSFWNLQAPIHRLTSSQRLFVFLLLSGVPNGFAKLSVLFILLTMFPRTVRPITAYLIWAGIAVVVLFYAILVLYIGIHCGPHSCTVVEQVDIAKGSASINLILDVYILAIAVVNVWTLQMSRRYRIGVIAVFATGLMALACSIIVLYYRVVTTEDPNAVWTQVLTPLVLVIYEPSIALITASLPAAPSLWAHLSKTKTFLSVRRLLSQSAGDNEPSGGNYELSANTSNTPSGSRSQGSDSVQNKAQPIDYDNSTKNYPVNPESGRPAVV
ncbi:hypothetical protein F5Y13DRAFT_192256 [Hypoxylon sp. FL1857]|nr:hypothetical protein F5Y13DRAFT_192256 [Hypoxylon sp. FL1857]